MLEITRLHEVLAQYPEKDTVTFIGCCHDCGCTLNIEIHPVSGGFGLLGGALFEPAPQRFVAKCPACFRSSPQLAANSQERLTGDCRWRFA